MKKILAAANDRIEKNEKTPLKRHEALKPLSREHHLGLLFCWKIRTGLQRNISVERMKKYADYFFNDNLDKHFEIEEKSIFPLISKSEPKIIEQALKEHAQLRKLFTNNDASSSMLQSIASTLNDHIRFEERVLFKKIQEAVSEADLAKILIIHDKKIVEENYSDTFWL